MLSAKIVSLDPLRFNTDGPGICTIVHTYGCNLSCKWCSNPTTWCGNNYKELTTEELFKSVSNHNLYFQSSGGGITFSGGEPLLWSDYIIEFSQYCKDNNWMLNVETACHLPTSTIQKTFCHINNYLIDIKHMNPNIHTEYIGVDNQLILENIKFISKEMGGDKIHISIPLIPGVNDDDNNIHNTCIFARDLGITKIKTIPYRTTGIERAKKLGVEQPTYEKNTKENIQRVKEIINSYF